MKKLIVLAAATGLLLSACAKNGADNASAIVNGGAANGDFSGGEVLANDDSLGANGTVPADETANEAVANTGDLDGDVPANAH